MLCVGNKKGQKLQFFIFTADDDRTTKSFYIIDNLLSQNVVPISAAAYKQANTEKQTLYTVRLHNN